MHHLPTTADRRRSLLTNLLLLGNRLLILSVLTLLLLSLFSNDHKLIYDAMLVGFSIVVIIAQWIATVCLGCPLCKTPVLAPIGGMELPCPCCNQPSAIDEITGFSDPYDQQSEISKFN